MENEKAGSILILDVKVQYKSFLSTNRYNSNTEPEQLSTFSYLSNMLNNFDDITN